MFRRSLENNLWKKILGLKLNSVLYLFCYLRLTHKFRFIHKVRFDCFVVAVRGIAGGQMFCNVHTTNGNFCNNTEDIQTLIFHNMERRNLMWIGREQTSRYLEDPFFWIHCIAVVTTETGGMYRICLLYTSRCV